jgi:hypothetical protein
MAELPKVDVVSEEAVNDITESNKDNRERLQRSMRGGLLNVRKSVDNLNATVQQLLELQQAGWDAQRQQAGLDLEASREAARGDGGGGDGDVTVNGDVTVDANKGGGGLFGKIGKAIAGGIGGMLSGLGIGGGALLAGAGILAGGAGFLLKQINELDGKAIRANVQELLGIKDDFGGMGNFFLEGGAFFLAMTGIGVGLAAFSLGTGVAAAVDYFTQDSNFAENIKQNVLTLLSIGDAAGGNLSFLADSAFFAAAMAGLGLGLLAFSIGNIAGSAASGIGDAIDYFTGGNWAETIKKNVLTLLSIKDEAGGNLSFLADSAVFAAAMAGLGFGLLAFSIGSVAGVASSGIGEAIDYFTGSNWAEIIKENVLTLLSIKDSLGGNWEMLKSGGAFMLTMAGIGAGLAAFAFGSGAAGVAEAVNKFASEEDMADRIVRQVKTLLTLTEEGAVAEEKANIFSRVMGTISSGLMKFAGGKFVAGLADAGTAFLNFLSGSESPIQEMLNIADRADDIFAGADAIDKVGDALNNIAGLRFDGSSLNIKDFAQDLMESIPAIETAIMGGTVGAGFLSSGTQIKGLASPDIDFESATKRLGELRNAMVANPTVATGAEVDVRSTTIADTGTATGGDVITSAPTVVNNVSNSQQSTTVAPVRSSRRTRRSEIRSGATEYTGNNPTVLAF